MSVDTSVSQLLADFHTATDAATQGLPAWTAVAPPGDGITLLDTKNEIFLAYLQALALRNLNVIRSLRSGNDAATARQLSDDITKRLVEHRVYLERGVRPLEQKLKFQVDRVVKAAEEAERLAKLPPPASTAKKNGRNASKQERGRAAADESSEEGSGSEDEDGDSDASSDAEEELDKTSFRPNLAQMNIADAQPERGARGARAPAEAGDVYRPPRVSATVMPTTDRKEQRGERKPIRSKTLDEFVSTEYSTAPLAQPSIGSNIAAGGRTNKNARQLKDEAERREYEEINLVRLPKQSKKDLAMKGYGRDKDGGFGGEEWRDLSNGLDRISDLTRRKGGKESKLDQSRKRRAPPNTVDGPRGDGIGSQFEMKKRRLQKKGQL